MKLLNQVANRLFLTCTIVLFSGFLFAQNLTVQISEYPVEYVEIMNQFSSIDEEHIEFNDEGLKYRISQKRGTFGYIRTYEDGSGYTKSKVHIMFKDGERDKGNVVIVDETGSKNKKSGSFKVKTSSNYGAGLAFSTDAKYAVAMSTDGVSQFAYVYNMTSKQLETKDQTIMTSQMLKRVNLVGTSGNGQNLYAVDTYNGWLMVVDMKTWKGTTYNMDIVKGSNYLFTSKNSNHFLIGDDDELMLIDGSNAQVVLKTNSSSSDELSSFFVTKESPIISNLNGKKISGAGIGMISKKGALMVFDQDLNYFTVSEGESDLPSYIRFNNDSEQLEIQPDLIPIISDVFAGQEVSKAIFFNKMASESMEMDNRKLAFQVFESAEPYSSELIKLMSQSDNDYVIVYMGKHVANWINSIPKITLAEDGKEANIKRSKFLEECHSLSQKLSKEEYGIYLANETEIQNALDKIKPLTADLFYMPVDELVNKGNQAIVAGAKLSPKAALLGLRFFEVAADKEPTEPIHQANIGNAYLLANEHDKAVESYNKALAIRPDYPLALFGIMKATFVPIERGEKPYNDNLAKSIVSNADRFLAVAPADYLPEMKYAKRAKAFSQLYLADQGLYAAYNLATGMSNAEMRTKAVVELMPKIAVTGNTFLVTDMANISGFDYIKIAESKNHDVSTYQKADEMLRKSVKGGVYDPETYYEWARININFLKKKDEGLRIVSEAQKKYPNDKNFGSLVANDYFNAGRDLYLSKSYTKAIPQFEKYIANAKNIVPKAYDYLGFSYYYTKNYPKAATNLQLLKDKDDPNTLQAYYGNFNTILAYANNPSGTAPVLQDNADKINTMEDLYMKGNDMVNAGQTSEGLKLMQEAAEYYDQIDYDYGQAVTHSGVGVTYHNADDTDNAKSHYEICVESGPQSSTCYYNLAIILIKEEQISKAKSLVNEGLKVYPYAEDLAKAKAYLYE